MFTPYERRQLRLIEEWFEKDDPQLARILRSGPVRKPSSVPRLIAFSVAGALGVLGVLTGVFMLLFGSMIAGVVAFGMIASRHRKRS
ncbi:hypothetical protein JOF56_004698 [Kibdelosporangium banguiense]|uniref:DUF3040 domain-containing protein n=1 Tax=Kibdelosporangium banguiense TaxID=1365924 RepID=A0ABS4TIR6_9PSEU|nr:DUF3040 domain-containing protein [Kibdelosporangium banguiense]MBP2324313.1 hypothetical protein [Kibdelosporangium banguiense]